MFGSDNFQIRHGEVALIGELTVTGADLPVGLVMDVDSADPEYAKLGGIAGHVGHLTKRVTTAGSDFVDMALGVQDHAAKSGDKVTIQRVAVGGQIEVEGADAIAHDASGAHLLVTTGTGAISGSTAKDTLLSIQSGRLRVAQTADLIFGRLLAQLEPVTSGNIRILVEIWPGSVK